MGLAQSPNGRHPTALRSSARFAVKNLPATNAVMREADVMRLSTTATTIVSRSNEKDCTLCSTECSPSGA